MKIKIAYGDKNYFLGFNRATAIEMGKHAKKSKNDKGENVFDNAELLVKHSLKAYQPKMDATEVENVTKYVLDNYNLVGKTDEDGKVIEKGLLEYLNDALMGCMPKGFTGQATMKFEIVEE